MKTKAGLGFAAFCVWAGSAWLYDLFAPGVLTGLPRTALQNGLLALALLAWARWHREPAPAWRIGLKLAASAAFLFASPAIVLARASAQVSQSTEILVYLLVPVVVVFCVGQQSAGFGLGSVPGSSPMRGLVPAVVGLGGAALILPFQLPSSYAGRGWLAALVLSAIAAGIAAVDLHSLLSRVSLASAGSIAFGLTCVAAACFSARDWPGLAVVTLPGVAFEALRLVLVDAPPLLLGLWLLREMRPAAFSARLLLVPAVTVLEGIVAERLQVGWYGWLGLASMGTAGYLLVVGTERQNVISVKASIE